MQDEYGVVILEPKKILPPNDYQTEIKDKSTSISTIRVRNHTYRNEEQVTTEAELQQLIKRLIANEISLPKYNFEQGKIYFVSQSRVFDHIADSQIITWSTEAVYRYITSLSADAPSSQAMQECMLNGIYSSGGIISTKCIHPVFWPTIDSAKLKFSEEKDKYIQFVESNLSMATLESDFESTPDLDKPYFVSRMDWQLADVMQMREKETKEKLTSANERIKELEALLAGKVQRRKEVEDATLRNAKDPKHIASEPASKRTGK